MSNALVPLEPKDLTELKGVADVFAASGLFKDATSMAQAFVRIMAGRELGFGAFASMNGINIIQGKPAMGANLIAAAIKRHTSPRYDYRVVELTNEKCVIIFLQDGEKIGESTFTMQDAAQAGLNGKDPWRKNPRNMLFARAISNGARWFCPDVFGGPVYTPEEMGAAVDEEGDIIDGEVVPPAPKSQPDPARRIVPPANSAPHQPEPTIETTPVTREERQQETGEHGADIPALTTPLFGNVLPHDLLTKETCKAYADVLFTGGGFNDVVHASNTIKKSLAEAGLVPESMSWPVIYREKKIAVRDVVAATEAHLTRKAEAAAAKAALPEAA